MSNGIYPKWMYHADNQDGRIVQSAEAMEALGSGWADSPAAALALSESAPEAEAPALAAEAPKAKKSKGRA